MVVASADERNKSINTLLGFEKKQMSELAIAKKWGMDLHFSNQERNLSIDGN